MFWNIKKIYGWIAVLSLAGLTAAASIHRFAAGTATWESRVMIAPVTLVVIAMLAHLLVILKTTTPKHPDAPFREIRNIWDQLNPFHVNTNGNKT